MSFNQLDLSKLHPIRQAGLALLKTLSIGGVGAEVGVYEGVFSKLLIQVLDPKTLYLIDPWQWRAQWFVTHTSEEQKLMAEGNNTSEGDLLYEKVKKTFAHTPSVKIMRKPSIEASKQFPDNYFDWVFIDGDHRYEPVLEDMRSWWPKVKVGGSLCGDDYASSAGDVSKKHQAGNGVRFAVDEFLADNDLKAQFFQKKEDGSNFYFKIEKHADAK